MKKVLFLIIIFPLSLRRALCIALFLVTCFIHAQVPSYVPTNGLLGYFGFNGNATDAITGVSPTTNTAILTSDRFGNANAAYRFNGAQTILYGSNHPFGLLGNSANVFTINLWVNGTDQIGNGMLMGSFGWGYFVRVFGAQVGIEYIFAGGPVIWNSAYSASNVHTGCWKMATITKNGSSVKVYIDGILNNSFTINYSFSPYVSNNNWFGANGQDNNTHYNGKIDDCGVWNRELSQAEITNLFQNYAPPVTNFSITATNTGCGQTPTLDAGSGFLTYNWSTGATTQTISAPTNGTYTCTVTDNSCTYVANKQVTLINASITQSANNVCKDQAVTLTASGGSSCNLTPLPGTLSSGLVGFWPFCGSANDVSGNNNNGTVNGATLTTDRFGNANAAYSFDGVDDEINTISNFVSNGQTLSVSGWFFLNSYNAAGRRIIDFGWTNGGVFSSAVLGTNTGGTYLFEICHRSNSTAECHNSNLSINTGIWYFFTSVFDNGVKYIYVNGNLISTINASNSLSSVSNPIKIGGGTIWDFHGKIDDITIYNRALSPSEIQQLYTLGNATYSWSTSETTQAITVNPSQTTNYSVTVNSGGGNCLATSTINVVDTLTWTGAVDTDWHKPCNWSPQFVPKCCNNVTVPLTSNQPIVSGVAAAEDLTIFTTNGAQLTVNNGANLQIADCPTTITTTTCPSLAVITTSAVTSITQTTAVSGGTITYQGASAITARGVCWSTSPNPTIANSTTSNGTGIGTFTSNLTGLVGGTTYYLRAYATNGSGTSYGNQVSFVAVNPQPAYPANSVFCASGPTLVVDVTSPTGKTWMDRNLGASQVATSSTDAAAYGDLYQWGRGSDGHQCRNSQTTTTLSTTDQPGNANFILAPNSPNDWRNPQNTNLWQGVNGVNNPCPSGYRLPSLTELDNERLSWGTNNSGGSFISNLKFTIAGARFFNNGALGGVGVNGNYWSTISNGNFSRGLSFNISTALIDQGNRADGRSIRCIKN